MKVFNLFSVIVLVLVFAAVPVTLNAQCSGDCSACNEVDCAKRSDEVKNFYSFCANALDGEHIKMSEFKGKVILVVNTASKCGLTPQYKGLEALYKKYNSKGLVILGFPCNQFGKQEPGNNKEIANFCSVNYGVTFPMFSKIEVNGNSVHPVYKYLKAELKGEKRGRYKMEFHQISY